LTNGAYIEGKSYVHPRKGIMGILTLCKSSSLIIVEGLARKMPIKSQGSILIKKCFI